MAGQGTKMTQLFFVVFGGLWGVLFPVGCGGTRVPEAGQGTKMRQLCFVVFDELWVVLFPVRCGDTRVPETKQGTKLTQLFFVVFGDLKRGQGARGRPGHKNDTVVPRCVWWVVRGVWFPVG